MTPWRAVAEQLEAAQRGWQPQRHQIPPRHEWGTWMLHGGRGIGKTDGGAYTFNRLMLEKPNRRGRIIAPTIGDAREACVEGISGLRAHNPAVHFNQQTGAVTWPNGSRARIFGAHTQEDVERLRAGGNSEIDWYEEWCAWRMLDEAWDQAQFGLRVGTPRRIITTTPKPRSLYLALLGHPNAGEVARRKVAPLLDDLVVTFATTDDNHHLPHEQRRIMHASYDGTRLGQQELLGQVLTDVPGALWTMANIEQYRVRTVPELRQIIVAVDPSGGDGPNHDEQGIVVAGKGVDGHGYVLADRSCSLTPSGWAQRAIAAYYEFQADRIVAEINYGGAMVKATLGAEDRGVPVDVVTASRGKRQRAEPVSALFEQGLVHMVGTHDRLEDQLCRWTPDSGTSPDRLDAMVWGLTKLMVQPRAVFLGVA